MINKVKISKAFSDKNRLKIMQILSSGERNVSDVAEGLDVEENLASHHLRVLSSIGILKSSKKGREVFYRLNRSRLITLIRDLNKNEAFREIMREALED